MRGLSELVSTIIVFSVVLTISVSGFLYAMYYLDQNQAAVEYGFIKSVFRNIAVTDIDHAIRLDYRYPYNYVAIGYKLTSTNVTFVIGNTTITFLNTTCLTASVRRPLAQGFSMVYGVNKSIVESDTPYMLVYEYYESGATTLVLDPSPITFKVVYVNSTQGTYTILYFTLVNFTGLNNPAGPPEIYGQGYMVVKHDPSKDLYFKYTNITTVAVYINGLRQSLPQDILNALSSSASGVEVDVRVLRVGVMAS
ncbi:MAG: hypothetical protein JHC12_06205 [Thermogladius sp.]|nr:hypothetical protein [Thermogladius sp.]